MSRPQLRRERLGVVRDALGREQLLQFAGLEHLAHDIAAADELALDVELRNGRPVGIGLDAVAHGRTVVLRLRFGDYERRVTRSASLPRPTRHTDTVLRVARALFADAQPLIAAHGLTLLGLSLTNLRDDDGAQLELPLDGRPVVLDEALDDVRDRYGARAIRRAVLLHRDIGPAMPTLPDRAD